MEALAEERLKAESMTVKVDKCQKKQIDDEVNRSYAREAFSFHPNCLICWF